MIIALKSEPLAVKEYINTNYIVSFWDGKKDGEDGVFIAMVDDENGRDPRHFTAFVYGTKKFDAAVLYEVIDNLSEN